MNYHLKNNRSTRSIEGVEERHASDARASCNQAVQRLHQLAMVEHVRHQDDIFNRLSNESVVFHGKVCKENNAM